MKKVAIYCRLSDEDRGKEDATQDSESIQNQKTMLIDYAIQNDWDIYKIYSDDDFSGADSQRPEYNKLLKDAEGKKFDIVLSKCQARFTRDMEHVEKYLHNKFIEWGIRFVGKVDNADTDVKGNKKSRQINGLVNEWYLEDASENIKAALDSKKKQGQFVGAFAPYGYKKDPTDKNHLIVDEEAAKVVKLIFKMYTEGKGNHVIAKYLNEQEIPCPSEYKRLSNLNYKNTRNKIGIKLWETSTINYILHHRVYIGDIVQSKLGTLSYKNQRKIRKPKDEWIIVENMHEPIIDKETFELITQLSNQKTRPIKTGVVDKYSGKIKCGECGGTLYRNPLTTTYKGEKKFSVQYRCKTNKFSPNNCKGACILEKVLDEFIFNRINEIISNNFNEDVIDSKIHEDNCQYNELDNMIEKKEKFISKIADIDKAFTNLYIDKVKEIISINHFSTIKKQLTEQKEKNEKILYEIEKDITNLKKKELTKKTKKNVISKYNKIESLDREIILDFIDYINVFNSDKRNQKRIEVYWNF